MKFTSALAIYALFWSFSFFLVLPFRLRSSAEPEPEAAVPGQAESAPPRFSFARTCLWTTIVSAILFGVYYLNYVMGWITGNMFDVFGK